VLAQPGLASLNLFGAALSCSSERVTASSVVGPEVSWPVVWSCVSWAAPVPPPSAGRPESEFCSE